MRQRTYIVTVRVRRVRDGDKAPSTKVKRGRYRAYSAEGAYQRMVDFLRTKAAKEGWPKVWSCELVSSERAGTAPTTEGEA